MSTKLISLGALTRSRPFISLMAFALVLGFAGYAVFGGSGARTVTADFSQVVNIHPGDQVRILGVPVGSVESVTPHSNGVTVTMTYDGKYRLATNASAAIVTPTLISVRYIQLGPLATSTSGSLPNGAVISSVNTAAPLEWDDIKAQVDQLAQELGPRDPAVNGALAGVLRTSSTNLRGTASNMQATLARLASAFSTLNSGGQDLFAVVKNLGTLTQALASNNQQVADFNSHLASVSSVLESNRNQVSRLLSTLASSSKDIATFLADNRGALKLTVSDLAAVVSNLAKSRQALADALQRAPTAVANLQNIYDPFSGALTTSLAATEANDPAELLCDAAMNAAPDGPASNQAAAYCRDVLEPLLKVAAQGGLPISINPNHR